MIIPDKKKMATAIVATMPGMPKEDDQEDGEGGDTKMLAGEVMKAVKAGDVGALEEALKAFHEACESYEDTEGEG